MRTTRHETPGEIIREARMSIGWTLRQLAKAAGVSAPFLSDVEHDRRSLGGETLARVAKALGISADLIATARVRRDVEAFLADPEVVEFLRRERGRAICPCCQAYGARS